MIYVNKLLPLVASPLFLVLVLVLWGIVFKQKLIGLLGVGILVTCSLPLVSQKLIAYLEKDYVARSPQKVSTADAIVVLSGMVRTIEGTDGLVYEMG